MPLRSFPKIPPRQPKNKSIISPPCAGITEWKEQTMKISKDFATPLTIGAFFIMASTGLMMFFHVNLGLSKVAHEWLGWLFITAVVFHVLFHFKNFKRYFLEIRKAQIIIACCALILVAALLITPPAKEGKGPQMQLVTQAVMNGSVADVAPLAGKSVDEVLSDLAAAGMTGVTPDTRLSDIAGQGREAENKILGVIFN